MLSVSLLGKSALLPQNRGEGVPETGEFNFMDYLLGLQVHPVDEMPADANPLLFGQKAIVEDQISEPIAPKKTSEHWLGGLVPSQRPLDVVKIGTAEGERIDGGLIKDPLVKDRSAAVHLDQENKLENANGIIQNSEFGLSLPTRQVLNLQTAPERLQSPKVESDGSVREKPKLTSKTAENSRADSAMNRYQAIAIEANKKANEASDRTEKPPASTAIVLEKPAVRFKTAADSKLDSRREAFVHGDKLAFVPSSFEVARAKVDAVKITSLAPKTDRFSISEVFEKVESLVHLGGGEMKLSLTPPELGKVEIHVSTSGNRVEVEMHSENALAKSALENSLGDLRQSLQIHDLNLARVEVFAGREAGLNFQSHSESSFNQQGFNDGSSFAGRENRRQELEVAVKAATNRFRASTRTNGVDIRI